MRSFWNLKYETLPEIESILDDLATEKSPEIQQAVLNLKTASMWIKERIAHLEKIEDSE